MTIQDIALYTFFLIALSWVSKRVTFLPLLCLLLGIGWGFLGHYPSKEVLQYSAKIALVFFLFVNSTRLHIPKILRYHSIRLPTIGLGVTLIMGMCLVKWIFPLFWIEAFVVTFHLIAVDGQLVPSAFSSKIPSRVMQMLNVEASCTTLLAFLMLSIFHLSQPSHFWGEILFPILAGIGWGYICGWIGKTVLKFEWALPSFFRGTLFMIPFGIFALCGIFGGNGFMGVIAAGLTFGHSARCLCDTFFEMSKRQGLVLFYFLIILLGTIIFHTLLHTITLKMVVFALLFLFALRFLAVVASFVLERFQWKTAFYFTFFAPKGLLPITAAFLFSEYFSFPHQELMLNVMLTTLLCSIVTHSLFASSIARLYAQKISRYPLAIEYFPVVDLPTPK